jgi:hypothetical protein
LSLAWLSRIALDPKHIALPGIVVIIPSETTGTVIPVDSDRSIVMSGPLLDRGAVAVIPTENPMTFARNIAGAPSPLQDTHASDTEYLEHHSSRGLNTLTIDPAVLIA